MKESAKDVIDKDKQADKINRFEANLKKRLGIGENIPDLQIRYVGEINGVPFAGMFIDGKIFKYIDSNGKEILNADSIKKKKSWYEKSLYMLGYFLDKNGAIYKRNQLDANMHKPHSQSERIHETGIDYFILLRKADFLINRMTIGTFKQAESDKYNKEFSISALSKFFNLELLKMKDVDDLEELGKISKGSANHLRKDLRKFIRFQCADERYEITDEIITEAELKEYKNRRYIDKQLYNQCIEIIKSRKKKEENMQKIKDKASSLLSDELTKIVKL